MKDAYYFPHEFNAHRDPKCAALIKDFGLAGYGLYWVVVEMLHQEGGKIKKFPKLFDGLSFQLNIEKEVLLKQIEALLQDYELLQQDQNCIWSDRVLRNLQDRKLKYQVKMEAGRAGGLRSGEVRKSKQNEALLEANEQKERKGKERKGKETTIGASAETAVVRNFFYSEFERTQGDKYAPNWGKDGKIFKNMLEVFPVDRIKGLITLFFEIKDEFIENSGYSVGVFKSVIPKLQTGKQAQIARIEREINA